MVISDWGGVPHTVVAANAGLDIEREALGNRITCILPTHSATVSFKMAGIRRIAVIGDNAVRTFSSGGYSAGVTAKYEVTALNGTRQKPGNR